MSSWIDTLLPADLRIESTMRQLDFIQDDILSKYSSIDLETWMKLCRDAWKRSHPSTKKPNEYNVFVKENYKAVRSQMSINCHHFDVLKKLGELYRAKNPTSIKKSPPATNSTSSISTCTKIPPPPETTETPKVKITLKNKPIVANDLKRKDRV